MKNRPHDEDMTLVAYDNMETGASLTEYEAHSPRTHFTANKTKKSTNYVTIEELPVGHLR